MIIRTAYSFSTAAGALPDVIARAKEIGATCLAIADRNSTFGYSKFTKAMTKAELRPVYGVELAVVPELGEKKPIVDFWSFLAIDDLKPLHDLIYLATLNPGREPSILYTQALAAQGVIKIAGERVRLDLMPADDPSVFVALMPSTPKSLYRQAKEKGLKFIARSDNYYPQKGDKEFYRVALGRDSNVQTWPQWILDDAEWRRSLEWFAAPEDLDAAISQRDATLAQCRAALKKAELLKPDRPATLRELCQQGAQRTGTDLTDPVYSARLDRELTLIAEKNFEDYFYILAEIISWAKERMIVGPARGSSCGSLVCYLLNITTIDPIPYGLIFERFIDINRKDLPDIDVDFSDERRHLVFEHMEEVYGSERVARLGTVGLYKAKSALKQAGTVLKIPTWKTEKALDGLVERSSADARAMNTLEDTLNGTENGRKLLQDHPEVMIAARMEGHPNNPSQHAAGMLLTQQPIAEYVAIDARTKSAMLDKKDAEELNLLKIDALGLTQLSVFERCLTLIGIPAKSGWLENLPLDDPAAFDVLNRQRFAGIFQFMGNSMQSHVKEFKISALDDMIAITALVRPGPLATGGTASWINRKNGKEAITSAHPMLTDLTRETYGVIIYQEQVMNIVRTIGKMSWEDTSAIRKAMSGTLGNEFFEKYWVKFLSGATENGLTEQDARTIWTQINTFGSWSFNRSHAVAYGIVSYWCCWLKAHHPLEFGAATLDAEADPEKQLRLLRELAEEGIDYLPVDKDYSTDRWNVAERDGRKVIVGPLTSIKGIGTATMHEIMTCRAQGKPIRPVLLKRLENAKTPIDDLYPIAAKVKRLHPDLSKINILTPPKKIVEIQCKKVSEAVAIGIITRIAPRDENDEANVQKRGGKRINATQTMILNMYLRDDTDEIYCRISRFDYDRLAKQIISRGGKGKAIYAFKGECPPDFRMLRVKQVKFLGTIDDEPQSDDRRQLGGDNGTIQPSLPEGSPEHIRPEEVGALLEGHDRGERGQHAPVARGLP